MPIDRKALAELRRRHIAGLTAVAVELTNQAKVRASRHVDNGTLRNSITHTPQEARVLWGIPLRSAPHAQYLELGFKPHWVPMRHIHLWARRRGVGQIRQTSIRSGGRTVARKSFKRARAVAMGVFVGGPGSTLEHGPGGAQMQQFRGRNRRISVRYATRGGRSDLIPANKVGFSVLRWTVKHRARAVALPAFARGWRR